jgi:SPP1 gp7 family putative phage head morphogenesis protein
VTPTKKTFPGPAPKEAVDYIKNKGWKPGWDYRDVWGEEHAVAFTVAKATRMEVLQSIRAEVERAITDGVTLRQFQNVLTPTLQNLGWWGRQEQTDPLTGEARDVQLGSPQRLRTIYDVNCRTARAAGQWQRAERTKKSLPYLLYQLGSAKKHRPQHVAWHGTLLPVDDPWWDTHTPPNGYKCKCHYRQVGEREKETLEQTGIPDLTAAPEIDPSTKLPTGRLERRMVPVRTEAPSVRYRNWLNKRTGETLRVPEGIDPGFDTNPGKTRLKNMSRFLDGKLKAADLNVAHAVIRDVVSSPTFAAFLEKPIPGMAMPVFRMHDAAAQTLGARQIVASLSEETLLKNKLNHPELTLDDYRTLPDLGEHPDLIVQDGANTVVLVRRGEKIYWGALKATRSRESSFLTSFRLTHPNNVQFLLKKGKIIYGEWK